jgi:hypothetical protein
MRNKASTVVSDIREGPVEQYWDRLQSMMGSNGLMTYWYLGRAFNQLEDPDTMRLRRDMRNPAGGIMAAPLAIAAPETGGWRDREVVPAPVAYSLHILDDARGVDEIRIIRSTVRQGRKMGFSRSEIVDAAHPDRTIAITTGIGVTLGAAPSGFRPIDLPPDIVDDHDLPPLHVVFGAKRHADGWRLPCLGPKQASTSASLHLGPVHVVFEAAASEAIIQLVGSEAIQAEQWDVHFVAPGTVGPFLVEVTAARGNGDRVATRLSLFDEGRDRSIVASGAAVFRVTQGGK